MVTSKPRSLAVRRLWLPDFVIGESLEAPRKRGFCFGRLFELGDAFRRVACPCNAPGLLHKNGPLSRGI